MERKAKTDSQAALERGAKLLEQGDVDGYWKVMAKHDRYAELAGDVAAGRGFASVIANGRLQQAALDSRGKKFSKEDMAGISRDIAKADLDTRRQNFKKEGDIRVRSDQTVEYHNTVFGDLDLPSDTYTPSQLQDVMGGFWSVLAGAPTKDAEDKDFWDIYAQQKEKFLKDPEAYLKEVGEAVGVVGEGLGDMLDELDRKVFEELEKLDRRYLDSLNNSDPGKSKPDDLMASADGDAPAGKDGDPSKDGAASQDKAASKAEESEPPEIAKFRQNLLKPNDPADEIMLKRTDQLTEDEVSTLTGRRIEMPPGQTRGSDMAEKQFAFFKHFFGDSSGGPIRPIPTQPTAPRVPGGIDLGDALTRIGGRVAQAAAGDSRLDGAIRGLQGGLNQMADEVRVSDGWAASRTVVPEGVLREDGAFGPKTRLALKQSLVTLGPDRVERALRPFLRF
ncbi:MAG: hypothetical protein QGI63_08485 [Rhodospirillales bacterium]|jgi:hypothetical protein|nr:hypothetical protein [Rhodospirillales bacterium]